MTVMPAPHDAAVDDAASAAGPAAGNPAAGNTADDGPAAPGPPGQPGRAPARPRGARTPPRNSPRCATPAPASWPWHGAARAADLLATIPPDTVTDRYGEGGVVTELESEIMLVLGQPAAVFLPSGTMAQQAVLRVHADRRQRRAVVFHPACHIDVHEGRGYERLHQLTGRPAGEPDRLLTVADLEQVAEPIGSLVIELPQRDLGGQQPDWAALEAQASWARERGAAVHLDGARLWESAAGYGRPPADIAALFDTVYVSFYKGLGALPGCCVAGPRTSSPRCASGGTGWAGPCSACGRMRRRPCPAWPGGCR